MNIPHLLNIYRRPRQAISGTSAAPVNTDGLIAQYIAYQYKHRWTAFGGCDSASCSLAVSAAEAESIFGDYIGNRVQIYVDNPVEPIFEGYINRVTLQLGAISVSRSLDAMMNRVSVVYNDQASTPNTKITTSSANANSIATYGTKVGTVDIQTQYTSGASIAAAVQARALAIQAWPATSIAPSTSDAGYNVQIEILGFYHTFDWEAFEVSNTTYPAAFPNGTPSTAENVIAIIYRIVLGQTLLTAIGGGVSYAGWNSSNASGNGRGLFYDDADLTGLQLNTSFTHSSERKSGETALELITKLVEAGDGVNRWVFGITLTSPNTNMRSVYYRLANTTVEYISNAYGDRDIYTINGGRVNPWDVRPDRSIRVNDILLGYNGTGADPRVAYLESIDYDAEQQSVSWTSQDDVSIKGSFGLNSPFKPTNDQWYQQRQVFI